MENWRNLEAFEFRPRRDRCSVEKCVLRFPQHKAIKNRQRSFSRDYSIKKIISRLDRLFFLSDKSFRDARDCASLSSLSYPDNAETSTQSWESFQAES